MIRTWHLPVQKGCDLEPTLNHSKEKPSGNIQVLDVFQHGNTLVIEVVEESGNIYRATLWDYLNESPSWRKLSAIAFEYEKLHNRGLETGLFWVRKDAWLKQQPPITVY